MRALLDSHVFLWCLRDDRRLSREARQVIRAPTSAVFVSAASIWEIAIKLSIGKVRWRGDIALESTIEAMGLTELPVTASHAAGVRALPLHHGDPFDRLLVAQARSEGLTIITADEALAAYGVPILSAQ